jgi:hypothetical protein
LQKKNWEVLACGLGVLLAFLRGVLGNGCARGWYLDGEIVVEVCFNVVAKRIKIGG